MKPRVTTAFLNGKDKKAYLYVVRCGRYVKVGMTRDLLRRIEQLQDNNPEAIELEMYRTVPYHCAWTVEADALARLSEHHHRGEWFVCSPAVAKEALRAACKEVPKLDRAARKAYAALHSACNPCYTHLDEPEITLQIQ